MIKERPREPTSDEVWLLKLISTGEAKSPSKIHTGDKTFIGFKDLQAMLSSLRKRGFVYYSDWNGVLVVLPKGYQYLATYEASSEKQKEKTRGRVPGRATKKPKRS